MPFLATLAPLCFAPNSHSWSHDSSSLSSLNRGSGHHSSKRDLCLEQEDDLRLWEEYGGFTSAPSGTDFESLPVVVESSLGSGWAWLVEHLVLCSSLRVNNGWDAEWFCTTEAESGASIDDSEAFSLLNEKLNFKLPAKNQIKPSQNHNYCSIKILFFFLIWNPNSDGEQKQSPYRSEEGGTGSARFRFFVLSLPSDKSKKLLGRGSSCSSESPLLVESSLSARPTNADESLLPPMSGRDFVSLNFAVLTQEASICFFSCSFFSFFSLFFSFFCSFSALFFSFWSFRAPESDLEHGENKTHAPVTYWQLMLALTWITVSYQR